MVSHDHADVRTWHFLNCLLKFHFHPFSSLIEGLWRVQLNQKLKWSSRGLSILLKLTWELHRIKQSNRAATRSAGFRLCRDAHWSHNNLCPPPPGLCSLCLDYRHNMAFLHCCMCRHVRQQLESNRAAFYGEKFHGDTTWLCNWKPFHRHNKTGKLLLTGSSERLVTRIRLSRGRGETASGVKKPWERWNLAHRKLDFSESRFFYDVFMLPVSRHTQLLIF